MHHDNNDSSFCVCLSECMWEREKSFLYWDPAIMSLRRPFSHLHLCILNQSEVPQCLPSVSFYTACQCSRTRGVTFSIAYSLIAMFRLWCASCTTCLFLSCCFCVFWQHSSLAPFWLAARLCHTAIQPCWLSLLYRCWFGSVTTSAAGSVVEQQCPAIPCPLFYTEWAV